MADLIDGLIADWQAQPLAADPRAMAIEGRVLWLANRMMAQVTDGLKPFGLQYTEFDVLATLRRKGAPFQLNPKQLMASVLITSGAMTACLDRLETQGLVARLADPDDRRGRIIQLTLAGRAVVEKAVATRFALADLSVSTLTSGEQKTLAKLLAKLMAK